MRSKPTWLKSAAKSTNETPRLGRDPQASGTPIKWNFDGSDIVTTTLSTSKIFEQRSEGFALLRFHLDKAAQIGNAIEALDAALQTVQTDNSATEQQSLVSACRALSIVLDDNPSIRLTEPFVMTAGQFILAPEVSGGAK